MRTAKPPTAVSPLISALVTKVSLFAWIRIMYWVLGAGQATDLGQALQVCWMLGAAAAVVGAFLALIQHDVKRMFAYGGVSHIGLIMLGAGLGNQTGLVGALFYLVNDAVMQATLFVLAGVAVETLRRPHRGTAGHAAHPCAVAGRRPHRRGALDDRHSAHGRLLR